MFVLSLTGGGGCAQRLPQSADLHTLANLDSFVRVRVQIFSACFQAPLPLCHTAIPVKLFRPTPDCLQGDLPSLPSVTNYRATGLGLYENYLVVKHSHRTT